MQLELRCTNVKNAFTYDKVKERTAVFQIEL